MSNYTLTSIDTTGIQAYIFGSNALRENIGASELVERTIGAWLEAALYAALGSAHNCAQINADQQLETSDLRAEVVMRGGGNALILFRDHADAVATIRHLSERLLCDAPGLEIAVAHLDFDWANHALGGETGVINMLAAAVNRRKQQRAPGAAVYGQAVLAECRATRRPAIGFDRDGALVSADIHAKLDPDLQQAAEQRFEKIFKKITEEYSIQRDADKIAADERGYLAVVHADGNGMGQRFIELLKSFPQPQANRACLNALRDLSKQIKKAGEEAFTATLRRLTESFKHPQMAEYVGHLDKDDGKPVIPFRPLVFGGDDVTFVCDGKLGLGLTVIFLEEFEQAAKQIFSEDAVTACAGIVICKSHYPFSRAYDLCEELCKQTKKARRNAGITGSGLDWHIAMSGISGGIDSIRKQEYTVPDRNQPDRPVNNLLLMRPLTLRAPGLEQSWRSWHAFANLVHEFRRRDPGDPQYQKTEQETPLPRSKVKALREVLREGRDATSQFLEQTQLKLPIVPNESQAAQSGWAGKRCAYFDLIEALDFYLPIERLEVQ
jgi:hypothetical protein